MPLDVDYLQVTAWSEEEDAQTGQAEQSHFPHFAADDGSLQNRGTVPRSDFAQSN